MIVRARNIENDELKRRLETWSPALNENVKVSNFTIMDRNARALKLSLLFFFVVA